MPDPHQQLGISRRKALIAAGAVPLAAMIANRTNAGAKVSQSAVHYQASPKDGKDCDDCSNFVSPSVCKLVDGDISPKGWCRLWVKKAS
jgi:hypothetical protein